MNQPGLPVVSDALKEVFLRGSILTGVLAIGGFMFIAAAESRKAYRDHDLTNPRLLAIVAEHSWYALVASMILVACEGVILFACAAFATAFSLGYSWFQYLLTRLAPPK